MLYARHQFELGVLQGDGRPLRDHLTALAKGRPFAALDGPPCPVELIYLWNWFLDLRRRAVDGVVGWDGLRSWCALRGVRPTQWEVDVLGDLESTMREVFRK